MAAPGGPQSLFPPSLPHGFSYLGWAGQAIAGEPRVTGNLEKSLSGERSPTRSAGLDNLPPSSLAGERLSGSPGTDATRSQGLPLLPRGSLSPAQGLGSPAAPTSLSLQLPVVGDPVAGVRFHQEGARHGSSRVQSRLRIHRRRVRSAAAGAGRVRLISIARRLGQSAHGAAGAGRGGTAGPGFGATPKTGARRGGWSAWPAGPAHGTSLARAASHVDPWGLTHPLAADERAEVRAGQKPSRLQCTGSGTLRGTQPGSSTLTPAR